MRRGVRCDGNSTEKNKADSKNAGLVDKLVLFCSFSPSAASETTLPLVILSYRRHRPILDYIQA